MPYAIRLPDGTLVENIPDEVTPQQAKARILRSRPDLAPSTKRTWGEAATDIGAGVTSGVGKLVQLPGQLYGLASGDFDTAPTRAGARIEALGEGMKSEGLKAREAQRQQAVQAAESQGQIEAFKTAFTETVGDPALATSFIAEQLPNLALMFVTGGTSAAVAAGRASASALARGASKEVAARVARQAATRVGAPAAAGAGAVMQGADVGTDTYDAVVQRLQEQGATPEEAAREAINTARSAGASAATISFLINRYMPGGMALERALVGQKTGLGLLGGTLAGAAKEVPTEVAEETVGGQLLKNISLRSVDPTQALAEGLGEAGGTASAGALLVGGGAGALSGGGSRPPRPSTPEDRAEIEAQTLREQAREQARAVRAEELAAAEATLQGTDYAALEQRRQLLMQQERTPAIAAEIAQIREAQQRLNVAAVTSSQQAQAQAAREAALAQQSAFASPEMQQIEMGGMGLPGMMPVVPEIEPTAPTQAELEAAGQLTLPLRRTAEGQPTTAAVPPQEPRPPAQMFLPGVGYSGGQAPQIETETPAPTMKELEAAGQLPLRLRRTAEGKPTTTPIQPELDLGPEPTVAEPGEVIPEPVLRKKPVPPVPEGILAMGEGSSTLEWARKPSGQKFIQKVSALTPDQVEKARTNKKLLPRDTSVASSAKRDIFDAIYPEAPAGSNVRPEPATEQQPAEPSLGLPVDGEPTSAGAAGAEPSDGVGMVSGEPSAEPEPVVEGAAPAAVRPSAFTIPTRSLFSPEREAEATPQEPGTRFYKGDAYRTPEPQAAPAAPISDADLRGVVAKVTKALGLKGGAGITVLDSVTQLDPTQAPGSRSGVVTEDGQVYLFRDGIANGVEGQKSVFHELVHKGLRVLFSPQVYMQEMTKLYRQSAFVRERADAWLKVPQNLKDVNNASKDPAMHRAIAVDEVLATMAEDRKPPGVVRQLGNWLAGLADRMGLTQLAKSIRTMGRSPLEAFVDDALRASSGYTGAGTKRWSTPSTILVDGIQRPTVNSEGRPIHPTEEGVRNFWKWFGDSKVVDAQGRPLVVYHGTRADFSTFNKVVDAAFGHGYYFASDPNNAEAWASRNLIQQPDGTFERDTEGLNVIPVYLALQNPADYSQVAAAQRALGADWTPQGLTSELKKRGFDGVLSPADDELVAFESAQIKSAVGNQGSFSSSSPDIRYRTAPAGASPAERARALVSDLAPQEPDPNVARSAREALTSALQNPREAVRSVRESTASIAERFGNWAWSTDTILQGELRRAGIRANMTAPQLTDLQMRAATNLAVHSENSADQFMQDGAGRYDPETHSFRTVKSKNNFDTLAGKFADIAKKYDMSVPEVEQMWHLSAEAARTQELMAFNTQLQTRAAELEAAGETKRAAALLEKVRPMQRTTSEIAKGLELAKTIPELREASKIWDTIRGNTLDLLVESGMHSQAEAEALFDNMAYVPFYRDEQLEANKGPKEFMAGFMVQREKALKGSTRPVADIFDNSIRWTRYAVERGIRNRKAVDMVDALVDAGIAEKVGAPERGRNVARVYRNGEVEFYDVQTPGVLEAFQGMESVAIPALSIAAKMANVLRQSIVLFPLFPILQVPQDSFAAMFSSGLKPRFALTIPARAVMEFARTLAGTSRTHEQMRRYGATGQKDVSSAIRRNDYEVSAGVKGPPKFRQRVLAQLHHISMASDNAVRQAVYQAAEAQGMSRAEALKKATDIINFRYRGRSGALAAAAQVIPFFNAYLAATQVVYKTVTGTGLTPTARADALKTLGATTAVVLAASFVYAAMASGDDEYEEIPSYKRDRMLLVPGTGMGVPLRPDVFLLPKIVGEHLWNTLSDNGTTDGPKLRTAVKDALLNTVLSPSAVPQIVKPALEVMTNYNSFTQRALIGPYEKQLDASLQFNERTSEMSKALSSAMGRDVVSPIALDHMIRGWFGSVGGTVLYLGNILAGELGEVERADLPFRDAVATFPGLSSVVTKTNETGMEADFYVLRDAVRQAKVSYDRMEKTMPQLLDGYVQDEKVAARLDLVQDVESAAGELTKIMRERREIVAAPSDVLTASEKSDLLRELDEAKAAILKDFPLRELRKYARL